MEEILAIIGIISIIKWTYRYATKRANEALLKGSVIADEGEPS
jgi:hypothetical protein